MGPLIAEDLLLLLLDDETGKLAEPTYLDVLLGGALLTELALTGAVQVGENEGLLHRRKVHPSPRPPALEDPLLTTALATVTEKARAAEDLVPRLGKHVREELIGRLVDRGVLREESTKVLGVFPRHRWPAVDTSRDDELRARLRSVLVDGTDPDDRTGALVALLHAVDRADKTIDHGDLPAREVRKRAKVVAEGEWAAAAVRSAVQASQAAIIAAVATVTVVSTGS